MRRSLPLVLLLSLLGFVLLACGPTRRGSSSGSGDDDDSVGDDDDAADDDDATDDDDAADDDDDAAGMATIVSEPTGSITLPAVLLELRSDYGVALVMTAGDTDCSGWRQAYEEFYPALYLFVDGELSNSDFNEIARQSFRDAIGGSGWILSATLGFANDSSGTVSVDVGDWGDISMSMGWIGTASVPALGYFDEGMSEASWFDGLVESADPFGGWFLAEGVWVGGDYDDQDVSLDVEATASLCAVDVRSP